jgi:hypothetical protein
MCPAAHWNYREESVGGRRLPRWLRRATNPDVS